MIDLKSRRELLWDDEIIEKRQGVSIISHKPVRRGVAFSCDEKWEGCTCGYPGALKDDDGYRLYYRASGGVSSVDGSESYCVAKSNDGKTYERPVLNYYSYEGNDKTNIMHREERFVDCFSIFKDTNPKCPKEERYKALSLFFSKEPLITSLYLYVSEDGYTFTFKRELDFKGIFDTYNVLLYDEKEGVYKIYFRDFHNPDGTDKEYYPDDEIMKDAIRDVRLTTSKDLITFTKPVRLNYGKDAPDYQMYTNHVMKYPRADVFVGFPTRYLDRRNDRQNFKHLSDVGGWRTKHLERGERTGSAVTDCVFMYSRDGINFKRDDNALLAPEYEEDNGWVYGDCYPSYNLVETLSDENPSVKEYSLYMGHGYRVKNIEFVRYSIRLDGFYSMRADFSGGEIMTKPMTLGDTMAINFSTSALGHVRIVICDEGGAELDGYDTGLLFGNSTDRRVEFEKPLSELSDRAVRLKIEMKDADIYSICCDL